MQISSATTGHGASRRKLAAILNADVVGYSRLMRQAHRATLESLTAYRAVMQDWIGEHGRRELYPSATSAHAS